MASIAGLFGAIVDDDAQTVDLPGLAGPNEFIEIAMNTGGWIAALVGLHQFTKPFTSRLQERAADHLANKLFGQTRPEAKALLDLSNAAQVIRPLVEANITVAFTLLPEDRSQTGVSLTLDAGTPQEIDEAVCALVAIGSTAQTAGGASAIPDYGFAQVQDDGTILVRTNNQNLRFSSTGELIESGAA
ncbi:hypothetical protein [Novosphingobium sp.]|uniref:hypothetical protein n=1 Tax=Novosphingobium sp. TaxID=1874826 RepID=UPI002733608A|nr:hypothetical protein [Novosphingobium sp.]MDP3905660.1 hypothetical protein [Novosphingobium sp.]